MAELTVDVHHLEIHHFDVLLPNQGHNILHSFAHLYFSSLIVK